MSPTPIRLKMIQCHSFANMEDGIGFVSLRNFLSQEYVYILVFLTVFITSAPTELRKEMRWPTTGPTWENNRTNMKLVLTSKSPCCRSQYLRKNMSGLFVFLYMHYVQIILNYHTLTFEIQLWKKQLKSIIMTWILNIFMNLSLHFVSWLEPICGCLHSQKSMGSLSSEETKRKWYLV